MFLALFFHSVTEAPASKKKIKVAECVCAEEKDCYHYDQVLAAAPYLIKLVSFTNLKCWETQRRPFFNTWHTRN